MKRAGAGVSLLVLLLALAPAGVVGAADADAVRVYQHGLALRNGIGMAVDAAAARRALDAAARAGVPAAMFTLAQMLAAGEGGARDEAASRAWIGRAAQAEYPEALQELALRETDPVQAAQRMREAEHALRHRAIERRGVGY